MAEQAAAETRDRRIATAGFVLLAVTVACGFIALLVRQLGYGLEFDESYLLGVARNLAEGRGYLDDGVTFPSDQREFAPDISSGPTVLLPVALAWLLTDGSLVVIRATMILFTGLLIGGTWWIFVRLGGRWVALAALSGLLMIPLATPDLQNASLMPGRVVGELPALAFLVLSAALISHRHYLLAGLAAGLCLEAKLTFALPLVVMLIVWAVAEWRGSRREVGRLVGWVAVGTVLPLIAFEAYKVSVLGMSRYADHLAAMQAFADKQDIDIAAMLTITGPKFWSLTHVIPVPALAVVVILILVHLRLNKVDPLRTEGQRRHWSRDATAVLSLSIASAVMVLWWLLRMMQTSPRPALPAVAWLSMAVCGVAMLQARALQARQPDVWSRSLAVALYAALLLTTLAQAVLLALDDSGQRLLAEQRDAAGVVARDLGRVPRAYFWTNPELLILTRLPSDSDPLYEQEYTVFTAVRALIEKGEADARVYLPDCGETNYVSASVVICRTSRDLTR